MTQAPAASVWPGLSSDDALALIDFAVQAFGFVRVAVYTGDDPTVVEHAELHWPEGGTVMLGSVRHDGEFVKHNPPGAVSLYVVTTRPDEIHAMATAAGARIVRELRDEGYGSRGFTAADPDGNLWSFGTYAGAV